MFTKNKLNMLLGILLVFILSLSGGLFLSENVVHAQGEEPTLHVELNYNWVDGQNWPLDSPVSITIYDPIYDTQYTDSQDPTEDDCWADTCVQFDLGEAGFDIKPGHIVTLTSGSLTKKYTVQYLEITKVNIKNNTIEGYAVAGSELSVSAHNPCWVDVPVTAGNDGIWMAYFDKDNCDLSEAEFFSADQQGLEEGTGTSFLWQPPYLSVDTYFDYVFGMGWLPGSEVTLTINGPDIQGTENFTLTKTVGVDTEFTPDTVQFDFHGDFYVQPGHIVTLSDGGMSVVYEVEELEVTKVDPETKTVEGTAESDVVLVSLGDPWAEQVVDVENGKWFASFDDLVPGTWGMAQVPAEYGNSTTYSWVSPMPATYNINPWWSEVTVQTGDDVNLSVQWSACTNGLIESYQNAAHIDITINGEPLFPIGEDAQYWSQPEPTELDGCIISDGKNASISYWSYPFAPLEPGIYDVHFHYWLDRQVTYGTDWDGDGKIDKFEGTIIENTVTIVVK